MSVTPDSLRQLMQDFPFDPMTIVTLGPGEKNNSSRPYRRPEQTPGGIPSRECRLVAYRVRRAGAARLARRLRQCTFSGGNCYCEAFAADVIVLAKQPVNTLSALFPVIAGLIILAITDRDRAATVPGPNPMATGRFHALLYGGLVVFLGPGSMFFHGSLTHYGGWLDNFSMILYVTFILCYDAARIWHWDDRIGTFAAIFVAINVLLGLLTWLADGSGTILFAILAGVAIVTQAVILLARPGGIDRRFVPWLLAGLASFGVASIIWALSATGRPLCVPEQPPPGPRGLAFWPWP